VLGLACARPNLRLTRLAFNLVSQMELTAGTNLLKQRWRQY
jgi:hypothetical protein